MSDDRIVSQPNDPVPQRIGDAERDRATEYLREHLAQGRLDQDEFDARLGRALGARTSGDLDPLFSDLPSPKPGSEVVPAAPAAPPPQVRPDRSRERIAMAAAIVSAVMWPVVLIAWLGFDIGGWWLVFIPIMFSSLTARLGYGNGKRDRSYRHQRRLDR